MHPIAKITLALLLMTAPVWGQHAAHTHGRAELNLIVNSDHELMAELIAPAESVYGFEHTPRNAKEKAQKEEGLKRLKSALAGILTFEQQAGCMAAHITEQGYRGSDTHKTASHEAHTGHDHGHHHGHDHDKHEHAAEEHESHLNVAIQWKVQCGKGLIGQKIGVNWNDATPDASAVATAWRTGVPAEISRHSPCNTAGHVGVMSAWIGLLARNRWTSAPAGASRA